MPEAAVWLLGAGLFGTGTVLGLVIRDFSIRRSDRFRAVREQELQEQLVAEQESFVAYKGQVTRHMDQTAHLFRDLTHQHAALYDHLAQGARELAPRPERLGGQAFGPALVEFASEVPGATPAAPPPSAAPPQVEARAAQASEAPEAMSSEEPPDDVRAASTPSIPPEPPESLRGTSPAAAAPDPEPRR